MYSNLYPNKTSLGRNKSYSIKLMKEQNYDIFHLLCASIYTATHNVYVLESGGT